MESDCMHSPGSAARRCSLYSSILFFIPVILIGPCQLIVILAATVGVVVARSEQVVAIKEILPDKTDKTKRILPKAAQREIRVLQRFENNNIINMIEICQTRKCQLDKPTFYLVLDYCEYDLRRILSNANVAFSLAEIKMIMIQLLNGLLFLHTKYILHRDVKPENILITKTGAVKLADFNLARQFDKHQRSSYTNHVVTLFYRPPELLLGARYYGPSVDMWSVGCIMAEMFCRRLIFGGETEQGQLMLICRTCGSIDTKVWPGVDKLELYHNIELPKGDRKLRALLQPCVKDRHACDLIDRLLTLDPSSRIGANDAMDHALFWTKPLPCGLSQMLAQLTPNSRLQPSTTRDTSRVGQPQNQAEQPQRRVYRPYPLALRRRKVDDDTSFPERVY